MFFPRNPEMAGPPRSGAPVTSPVLVATRTESIAWSDRFGAGGGGAPVWGGNLPAGFVHHKSEALGGELFSSS